MNTDEHCHSGNWGQSGWQLKQYNGTLPSSLCQQISCHHFIRWALLTDKLHVPENATNFYRATYKYQNHTVSAPKSMFNVQSKERMPLGRCDGLWIWLGRRKSFPLSNTRRSCCLPHSAPDHKPNWQATNLAKAPLLHTQTHTPVFILSLTPEWSNTLDSQDSTDGGWKLAVWQREVRCQDGETSHLIQASWLNQRAQAQPTSLLEASKLASTCLGPKTHNQKYPSQHSTLQSE